MRTVPVEDLSGDFDGGSGGEAGADGLEFVEQVVDEQACRGERQTEPPWSVAEVAPRAVAQLVAGDDQVWNAADSRVPVLSPILETHGCYRGRAPAPVRTPIAEVFGRLSDIDVRNDWMKNGNTLRRKRHTSPESRPSGTPPPGRRSMV